MITTRPTQVEDVPYLIRWLSDEKILRWFPMATKPEIDDSVRIWMAYANMGASLTAVIDGKPVGSALLYIQPYKKLAHTCLFSIVIDEAHRGKGVGTFLMQELMKLGKEKFHIEILHLEVYQGNPAIGLYRKLGFTEFGKQTHFIKDKNEYIGKILMQKAL